MWKNYLTIARRSLWKQKGYAAINVVGLAVGLAFCTLIFLYVRDEFSYDRFHAKADRIYRAHRVSFDADGSVRATDTSLPFPTAPALKTDLPEVEAVVRFLGDEPLIRRGEQAFEQPVLYTDPNVFAVFDFDLLRGDAATALADLNSIVLTETTAQTYFGSEDPMGQVLSVRIGGTFYDLTVTGVAQDVPGNSSLQFEALIPVAKAVESISYFKDRQDSWSSSAFKTYVLLREDADPESVRAKLPAFRKTYYPDEEADLRERGLWTGAGMPTNYGLQPLEAIHLNPEIRGLEPTSSPTYSYILAAIALGVLLIACINFMTLAMGRSTSRAKEVGVRKAVGAARRQLIVQFWTEAVLLSLLALGLGLALAALVLPVFNELAGKSLRFEAVENVAALVVLVGLAVLTGLAAGSYPALVLSGFRPVEVLKNRLRLSGSNAFTRTLVVAQFSLSVFLIASTFIMLDQIDYVRNRNLGFDQEHVVVIDAYEAGGYTTFERFRDVLGDRTGIEGVTGVSMSFAKGYARTGFEYKGELVQVVQYNVETDYLDFMDIPLVAGRNFDPNLATDSTQAVIVNEALVRKFGWTEPLGEPLTGLTETPATDPFVVGVVEDFNFKSLHDQVEPMMLMLGPPRGINTILVRLEPGSVPATLDVLRATWQQVVPDAPFQYTFLDDDLAAQYESEQRWSRIVGYGALFAVLIACLGLFGLAALAAAARTKEIGIRKVLGASVANLVSLLSKDFAWLVVIAVVMAAPAAYFVMQRWLADFAYRIDLSPWVFVAAGLAALGIALLPVLFQAGKAALADPVKSLRYE